MTQPSITCPDCGRTSYNPNDISEGYCGNCRDYTRRDCVLRIHGLIQGGTSAFDGEYIVEYDPGRAQLEPGTGMPMQCHLVTSPDITQAKHMTKVQAFELWTAVDPQFPVRADGQPNRPLTAFNVEIMPVNGTSIFDMIKNV